MSLGGFLFIARHVQKHVGADALHFHSAVRLDFIHEGFAILFLGEALDYLRCPSVTRRADVG